MSGSQRPKYQSSFTFGACHLSDFRVIKCNAYIGIVRDAGYLGGESLKHNEIPSASQEWPSTINAEAGIFVGVSLFPLAAIYWTTRSIQYF